MAFNTPSGIRPVTSGPLSAASGIFQSPMPATARWLDQHPDVADLLGKVSVQMDVLGARAESAYVATTRSLTTKQEADAFLARLHHDARESGLAVDPDKQKHGLRAKQIAISNHERLTEASASAVRDSANTRDATNAAIRLVNELASTGADVVMAAHITLKERNPIEIVDAQRQLLAQLDEEKTAAETAPMPLDDALAMAAAKLDMLAAKATPHISIGTQSVDWRWPWERLNVQPLLGVTPVDIIDVEPMLAALMRDQMLTVIEAGIRRKYETIDTTFDPTQRRAAIADVVSRRRKAEHIEIAAIFACWERGNDVPLRADTNPLALLGIERVVTAPAEPVGFIGKLGRQALGTN